MKIIERPLTEFGKGTESGVHVKEPTKDELIQAVARAEINGYMSVYIYTEHFTGLYSSYTL